MPATVEFKPEIIRWAIDRSGLSEDDLAGFPVADWEAGKKQPTLKKLEDFAKKTMVPLGYLLLDKPPLERITIPNSRFSHGWRQACRPSESKSDRHAARNAAATGLDARIPRRAGRG
jgi:hypothetical protein